MFFIYRILTYYEKKMIIERENVWRVQKKRPYYLKRLKLSLFLTFRNRERARYDKMFRTIPQRQ